MRNLLIVIALSTLASCQTLAGALGGGLGGGIGAALGGPPAAAVGAVGGVIAMETMVGGSSPVEVAATAAGIPQPQGQIASTLHESGGLIEKAGWWWLIIFVFLPLLRKNGRDWFKKLGSIHKSVSQQDIEELTKNTVSKKDVDDQLERLHRMEGILSSIQTNKKS